MKYLRLGDQQVSVIGIGTMQFGSEGWGWGQEFTQADVGALMNRALELGVNFIDTAEIYGQGRSEEILGRALKGRREQFVVATKVAPHHLTRRGVWRAAQGSLRRLDTGYIDLYQVHWPNPLFPLGWAMQGMADLLASGQVRQVGVSNFNLRRWQRAEALLGRPVIANQVAFHLLEQRPLEGLVPYAQAAQRAIIAYSPLAQGLLSGKYTQDRMPSGRARRYNPLYTRASVARAAPLISALREVARRHNLTPGQVAIAWVLRSGPVIAIPAAKTVQQLEENARAADLELPDQEWQELAAVARQYRPAFSVRSLLWGLAYRVTR